MYFNAHIMHVIPSIIFFITVHTEADDACADKIHNCRSYGSSVCGTYQDWAKSNCAYTCSFCGGPPPKKECVDNRNDCDQYVNNLCTSSSMRVWAEDNCSKFCGFCSVNVTTKASTTGVPVTSTTSKMQTTGSTPMVPASTQKVTAPCFDGLNFCMVYSKRACTNIAWAEIYCKKYCSRC